jgi:hemerythrin-like domain-containing protein
MSNYAARNSQGHHQVAGDDPAPIAHLKREHHAFRTLVDRINAADDNADKKAIAEDLHRLLASHIALEEEIFYPRIRDLGLKDEVNEGLVEHDIQRFLSAQIAAMDGSEELYGTRLGVLGEMLVHHLDEEDDEMFLEAKRLKLDFEALNAKLEAREDALDAQYEKTGRIRTPELDRAVQERNAV